MYKCELNVASMRIYSQEIKQLNKHLRINYDCHCIYNSNIQILSICNSCENADLHGSRQVPHILLRAFVL